MNIIDFKTKFSLYFLYLNVKDAGISYKFYQEDFSHLEFYYNPTTNQICIHLRIKRSLKSLAMHTLYLINGLSNLNIVFYDDECNEKLTMPCNKHINLDNRGSYFELLLTVDFNEVRNFNIKIAD